MSSEKSAKAVRKPKDFEELALASTTAPGVALPLTMDGTSVVEISLSANRNFAAEIMAKANKKYNRFKLEALKNTPVRFRVEAKDQILSLLSCVESMEFHNQVFVVSTLFAIGTILNEAEGTFEKKSEYMQWLREDFGHKHLRYFQQAKQLASMGDFARTHACIGKNRLLELERIKEEEESFTDLLQKFPFPDTTEDIDGELFKEHVDAIITNRRFQEGKVDSIIFPDATLIAAMNHLALEVNKVEKITEWLGQQPDQKTAVDDLLLNKLVIPYGDEQEADSGRRRESLNKLLAGLQAYGKVIRESDREWLDHQKKEVGEDILKGAYQVIVNLARKLKVGLSDRKKTTKEGKEN